MNEIIRVEQIAPIAMTEESGIKVREKIAEAFEEKKQVILDFTNVSLFATPFFNASIGYYIIKLTPEKALSDIVTDNLSLLGKETYEHSVENARRIHDKKDNPELIGKITAETIEGK